MIAISIFADSEKVSDEKLNDIVQALAGSVAAAVYPEERIDLNKITVYKIKRSFFEPGAAPRPVTILIYSKDIPKEEVRMLACRSAIFRQLELMAPDFFPSEDAIKMKTLHEFTF